MQVPLSTSETDMRRVASAILVLQEAVKLVTEVKPEAESEFILLAGRAGMELESYLAAALYEVSGYNVVKFVIEQRGSHDPLGPEFEAWLKNRFPEVKPK